jgi:hypothetical protein
MKELFKNPLSQIATLMFTVLTGSWVILLLTHTGLESVAGPINLIYNFGLMALFGGVVGLYLSGRWGGMKSVMGRAIIMLSLGLLAQEFGQFVYGYYIFFLHVAVPYPSLGDVGYFGSIPFYIYGAYLIAKASGAKVSLRSLGQKIIGILLPLGLLATVYGLFLTNYNFAHVTPLRVFLDFGYPLGQTVYISITLLAFIFSLGKLGGVMRGRILLLLAALFAQFIADFTFLYMSSLGIWVVGGISDYLYLIAYFLMTIALIRMKLVFDQVKGAA